jgi:hypothetical protein
MKGLKARKLQGGKVQRSQKPEILKSSNLKRLKGSKAPFVKKAPQVQKGSKSSEGSKKLEVFKKLEWFKN